MKIIVEDARSRYCAALALDVARSFPGGESLTVAGRRSAWRTFDAAASVAARTSAKVLVEGDQGGALNWARAAMHLKNLQMQAIHRGY